MAQVKLGARVPEFTVPSTSGEPFAPSRVLGTAFVLYFYPRDATPGCTQEGQDFAALHPQFRRAHTQILGISRDSLASHEKFRAKLQLPFHLLSDADETACKLFDVIHEKNMYGKKVLGVVRSTFLIDAAGVLRHEWRKLKVAGHAEEVLEAARSLD